MSAPTHTAARTGAGDRQATDVARGARTLVLLLLSCCYAVLWVGGVAEHWLKGEAAASRHRGFAALFLTLAGLIVLAAARTGRERARLCAVALLGFGAEVLGVHSGAPFGSYAYADALGPKLLGVPPAIAFAWMTLAAYVEQMRPRLRPAWVETIVAAVWLTAFDLLIDPLAANQLGYWRWADGGPFYGVPLTNFAGWFLVSLAACSILRGRAAPGRAPRLTGLSVVLFFTLLALGFGIYAVAALGLALVTLHVLAGSRFTTIR